MEYIDTVNKEIKEYFKILSEDFPEFLNEYIDETEVIRLAGVGMFCGTDFTKLYSNKYWFSRLDHSIGVALIIWNFTKDKKQAISGLLHDFSSPVFSHVIDFLRGDSEKQESTESDNIWMLRKAEKLNNLLKRDNIKLEEVEDYKIYPIADNEAHKLSADRLEYTFSTGYIMGKDIWTLENIKKVYNDISIGKNEDNIEELSFNTLECAKNFACASCRVAMIFLTNEDKLTLQYIADMIKYAIREKVICFNDLYKYSEQEIMNIMKNSNNSNINKIYSYFINMDKIKRSNIKINDKYCVSINVKKRFINPLIKIKNNYIRIYDIDEKVKNEINKINDFNDSKYAYIDFEF